MGIYIYLCIYACIYIYMYVYIYIYICIHILNKDSLRGSSVEIGTMQVILAWPLRVTCTNREAETFLCYVQKQLNSKPNNTTYETNIPFQSMRCIALCAATSPHRRPKLFRVRQLNKQ